MTRLMIVFLGFVLLTACNSNGKPDAANKDEEQKTDKKDDPAEEKSRDGGSQYTWTKAEQDKFLKECQKEAELNINEDKLKDFCQCMLTESQKYYPSYSHMDQKSNEDDDEEIFKKCMGSYGEDGRH